MEIYPTTTEERQQGGFTHRVTLTHTDLTQSAAATAQVIPLLALIAGLMVVKVATRLVTPFQNTADGAFNSAAITIGDGGTANLYLTSQETNANGTSIAAKAGTGTLKAYTGADSLNLTFNSMTGKSLVNLNAGALTVFLEVVNLVQLAGA